MKYPLSIRILHWPIAFIVLGLISLGWFMTPYDIDNVEYSENLYFWHKSFGMLVLFLMLGRLLVRLNVKVPELPEGLPQHEKKLSKYVHVLLYVFAFLVPFLGYVQSSTYEHSSGVYFFFTKLPEVFPDNKAVFEVVNVVHKVCAYSLLFLASLHIAGALKHRFFDKTENDVIRRMI